MRGLLAEFGIVLPQGVFALERGVPEILADAENSLSDRVRERFSQLFGQLRALGATVREWEHEILAWHRDNPSSRRLEKIPGIGPLGASALVASTGDIRTFKSGRQHGGQQRQPVSQSSVIDTRTRGEGGFMVITLIGYVLLALFALSVLAFCWLTASCFKLPTRSSHSGTSSLATTVGTGPPSLG